MASGQERILRRRIKSIDATKKITRAMELIAGSRIVRAMARVQAAKPYSEKVTAVIANLAGSGAGLDHPLLRSTGSAGTGESDTGSAGTSESGSKNSTAYVVLAADRGLCGGYNTNVLRAVERSVAADAEVGRGYELVLVGRKAQGYFRFRGHEINAAFDGFSDQPSYEDAKRIAAVVNEMFEAGQVGQVLLAYTQFRSIGTQEVSLKQFMPLDASEFASADSASADSASPDSASPDVGTGDSSQNAGGYEFEPEPAAIAERLLPRYVEARLYTALLEAAASEHAARQRAMKAATDNAEDLKTNLTRVMNRARQDAITTEIMEIVSGAEALEQKDGVVDLLSDTIEARKVDLFN